MRQACSAPAFLRHLVTAPQELPSVQDSEDELDVVNMCDSNEFNYWLQSRVGVRFPLNA
jgi:hypothetical protein